MKKIFLLLFLFTFCLSGCAGEDSLQTSVTPKPPIASMQDTTATPPASTPEAAAEVITDIAIPAPTEEPIEVLPYSPEVFYKENGDIRVQLYLTQADVTHDGIDDYIETCMYFPPETAGVGNLTEAIQSRLDVTSAIVQIYDGNTSTADCLTSPIWSKEYSSCHAGNGQVSIVYRDGLAYLLEGCLWQGQGFTGYVHNVIFFGETGLQYTKDEYSLQFYETDYSREEQIALVFDFKAQLEPWFDDAELIVATDVSLSQQFVSTPEAQYVPQDYYDTVWLQWTK